MVVNSRFIILTYTRTFTADLILKMKTGLEAKKKEGQKNG